MYTHKQTSPLHWVLHASALAIVVWSSFLPNGTTRIVLLLLAGLLAFMGFCFRDLTISVDQSELSIQFGPLPLFGRRISLANIGQVEASHSSWIDGWGIHFTPRRGWTYNLWGFECVEFKLNGRRFRVGTDDRDRLTQILAEMTDRAS